MCKVEQLLARGRGTPLYYYDMELLHQTIDKALQWSGNFSFRIHYAVKANTHPRIMQVLSGKGLGADCVSWGEVSHALRHGFAPEDIVFAGVGKTDEEIYRALRAGIFCFNVESLQELEVIGQIAEYLSLQARVCLRISPGVDARTHAYVSTGQETHKFGIREEQLQAAAALVKSYASLKCVGVHVHIGSQITDMLVYALLCEKVNQLQESMFQLGIGVEHLNLGGGLGVDYSLQEAVVPDFESYFTTLHKHLQRRAGQQVHVELGRSLVAGCGSLITRVLYVKPGRERNYVIIDAGMSELLRPALYGSKHPIVHLSGKGAEYPYWVAGPICETSDVLAENVLLPEIQRGDLLAIRWVGAYGQVMASRYNLRPQVQSLCSDEFQVHEF